MSVKSDSYRYPVILLKVGGFKLWFSVKETCRFMIKEENTLNLILFKKNDDLSYS